MQQLWVAPLAPGSAVGGSAYNTSTTLTDVSAAPQATIPANLLQIGSTIRVTAEGTFSNTATPTLLLGVYYGGVAGIALAATGAITTITSAVSWRWRLEYSGIVRSIGSAGTIMGGGRVLMPASLTQAQAEYFIPATASATVSIDTTTAKTLTIGGQWGTNSASNTLTCTQFFAEVVA